MKLHLASGNAHKVSEFQALANAEPGLGIEIISAKATGGMPEVVEDTGTFQGNARKKARALAARVPKGDWVVADDSGICVDELAGNPGVESAYYAGPQGDSAANLAKLVQTMTGVPEERRGAYFFCVLHLIDPDGGEWSFEGKCEGTLLDAPSGGAGFGYDPLFVPLGFDRSFADLGDAEKSRLSHRAKAWGALASWLQARAVRP